MPKKIKSLAVTIIAAAILITGCSLNPFADNTNTSENSNAAPLKETSVFMWEVSPKAPKSTKKLYLLGSVNVGSAGNLPLDKRIEETYSKSDVLVVDADISKIDQDTALQYVKKHGTYTAPDSLKNKISPKLYKKLRDKFSLGPNIDRTKPWLLAYQISLLIGKQNEYDTNLEIGTYFLNKAKNKKPILELESIESLFKMNSGLSDRLQEAFLLSMLDSKDYDKSEIDKRYRYWKTGNTKSMEDLIFPPDELTEEMTDLNNIIIYQRNIGMEKKIKEYLNNNTKTCFVVVDAAHLVGNKGIVSLLNSHGYKVNQM